MNKLHQIANSLSKIKHKEYELYVLSRIVHGLNDPGIKYKFQQYAMRVNEHKYALLDLYLPQFNIGIEVDEKYHMGQLNEDYLRQKEIETLYQVTFKRIDCSRGIDDVNKQTDEIINEINNKKEEALNNRQYTPWDGLSGYEHYRKTKKLDIEDKTELTSPTEICQCFGFRNAPQRGGRKFYNGTEEFLIWWPKENYEDSQGKLPDGDWYNKIDEKGECIIEYCLKKNGNDEHKDNVLKQKERKRIVFYRKRNMLNEKLYRFVGVFELDENESKKQEAAIWRRKETEFDLPEFYNAEDLLKELAAKEKEDKGMKKNNIIIGTKAKIDEIIKKYTPEKIRESLNKEIENKADELKVYFTRYKKLTETEEDLNVNNTAYIEKEILPYWEKCKKLEMNQELYNIKITINSMK